MKQLLALLPVFSSTIFFTVCGALNYNYEGSEESPIYKITIFVFGLLGVAVTFWEVFKKRIPLTRAFWIFVVFLPLFIITLYYIENSFYLISQSKASTNLLFMGAFSYTSIVATFYIAEEGINSMAKWLDVFMLIFSLAAINAIVGSVRGASIGVGGATYQSLSYYCAFAFNLNLCGILFGNMVDRYPLFTSGSFKIISYILLAVQLMGCFLGGGRGAIIYLVLDALLLLIVSKRLSRTMMSLSIFGAVGLVFLKALEETVLSGILTKRMERSFSFIDSEGQVHGEDRFELYQKAWDYCKDSNLMGTGLFKSNDDLFYPHNFFMELLMQGGVIYCLFWIILLIILINNSAKLVTIEKEYYLLPLILFPLTMLLFSGTYTTQHHFWFFVIYALARPGCIHK